MQLNALLEVTIGLVFVWLVLSAITMEIQNWLGQKLQVRAKFLEQAISDMFHHERRLVNLFYQHPFIKELCKLDKNGNIIKKPEYIPNEIFATVAFEVLLSINKPNKAGISADGISLQAMSAQMDGLKASVNPELAGKLDRLFPGFGTPGDIGAQAYSLGETFTNIENNVREYRKNLEQWFDRSMEQASNWFRQNAQGWSLTIGIVLALVFNIDTINIANQLWREPTIRQALAAQAAAYQPQESTIADIPRQFDILTLPIGWTSIPAEQACCENFFSADGKIAFQRGNQCRTLVNVPAYNDPLGWLTKLTGIFLSGLAARQGAPFWFDLLKKLLATRQQLKPKKQEPVG